MGGRHQQWQEDLVDVSNLEKIQRRNDVSVDGVRRLFEKGLMCSAEEQVGVVAGEDV